VSIERDRLQCLHSVGSIGESGGGQTLPSKKAEKDFCHSGESVLDLTFIRIMWDVYLK